MRNLWMVFLVLNLVACGTEPATKSNLASQNPNSKTSTGVDPSTISDTTSTTIDYSKSGTTASSSGSSSTSGSSSSTPPASAFEGAFVTDCIEYDDDTSTMSGIMFSGKDLFILEQYYVALGCNDLDMVLEEMRLFEYSIAGSNLDLKVKDYSIVLWSFDWVDFFNADAVFEYTNWIFGETKSVTGRKFSPSSTPELPVGSMIYTTYKYESSTWYFGNRKADVNFDGSTAAKRVKTLSTTGFSK